MSGIFLAAYVRGKISRGEEQLDSPRALTQETEHPKPQTLTNLFKQSLGTHIIKTPPQLPKN